MNESTYLGTESVGRLLRKFAVPCIVSLLISCLYNIVDQIFVGNGIGYLGNAATGVIFPVTVLGWGLSLFFGDGAAAALSVSLGRKETQNIHKTVGNSILCSFLAGLIILAAGYLGGDHLLRLIGATDANLALARDYGFIIYAMIPLALVQNTLASIIRADGSPRYAMGAMLAGAVINIIGDPLAIFVWGLGIKGAAYATILGQFVSFLICACYLAKSKTFRLSWGSFRLDAAAVRHMMALGTSSLLTQWSIVVVTVLNNILLVRYGAGSVYGPDIPLAAFVVIMKLFQIVLNVGIGIAAGAQPIVGYNYGAGQYGRVRELLKLMLKWTASICLLCTVLFEAVPQAFIRLFGSDGALYTQFATLCLRIYLSLILFTGMQKVCAIFLQSIGHAKAAAPLSILRDALLIVFSLLLPRKLGVTGIFWAAPAADLIAAAVTFFFMARLWKELSHRREASRGEAAELLQPSAAGFIVTISREHGSAGKRIGQLVAEKMGVPCYYKEMIALAAKESGLSKEFLSNLNADENAALRELYLSTEAVQQAVTAQDAAIKHIAAQGACVIVGRAADFVLRDHENVVRVFVYAPAAYRLQNVMDRYGDTREQGRKSIARSDAARAAYYQSISGRRWGDAHAYELCVDSSIGVEATAGLICDYLSRRQ